MASIQVDFDSYKLWYCSGQPYEALIYVYKECAYVGSIIFFKDGADVPANVSYPEPSIHFPLSRFNDVMTILREEKPLYLFLNDNSKIGMVGTSELEPTGEHEGK
jgi:hypothetical protein